MAWYFAIGLALAVFMLECDKKGFREVLEMEAKEEPMMGAVPEWVHRIIILILAVFFWLPVIILSLFQYLRGEKEE